MGWSEARGPRPRGAVAAFFVVLIVGAPVQGQENPATQLDLPRIEVIGTTPLPGIGLPPEQVPANVQTISADQVSGSRAVDAAGALNRALGSASVNDTQGNPFQTDLNFRGFTASPVLGTPQGLSVFVDGVRANAALGDTVERRSPWKPHQLAESARGADVTRREHVEAPQAT